MATESESTATSTITAADVGNESGESGDQGGSGAAEPHGKAKSIIDAEPSVTGELFSSHKLL